MVLNLLSIAFIQTMGCVNTKGDINETHPNIFEVMNVDEMGRLIAPGQLELTEMELILYQRGKSATKWPLRCLRKYGFDSEIFSFECGRRCPTGAGIYAFQCRKAEQLFNMLQQNIQLRNINIDNSFISPSINSNHEFSSGVGSRIGPPVQRQLPSQLEGYLNPTPTPVSITSTRNLSRPSSVSSNGPASPATPVSSHPSDIIFEHNNNKQENLIALPENSFINLDVDSETDPIGLPTYMNLNVALQSKSEDLTENYSNLVVENNCHLYMNVDAEPLCSILSTKDIMPNILPIMTETDISVETKPNFEIDLEETKHCYANIDAAELESLRSSFNPSIDLLLVPSFPETPTYVTVHEVNYAELDLIPGKNDVSSLPATPDSPTKPNKSYVTIDFKKTNALSQSVNPSIEVEEGSRKTRHNSTISDITTRHSNSLSD